MVELKNFDIAGAFQRGQQFGTEQRLLREGEQRRSRLGELASQAYAAPSDQRQGLVQQAIATDPQAGLQLDAGLADADTRRNQAMVNMARLLTSAPEQSRNGLYQQMMPSLQRFGLSNLPAQYDETVGQAAQSIVQAYSGNVSDGTPADIRSLQMLRDDPQLAALDRERRQYSGMVPKLVETSQGIGWGTPGGGIQLAPLEGVAGQRQPPVAAEPPQLFAALGQKYGLRPTSVLRTPERNREVGGVTNSYHLTGQAADWVVPDQFKAQFMADARANGFEAIDEGDHIHIEPARRGGVASAAGGGVAQPYQAPQRESVPAGYRAMASGGLEAIPGGPADPSVMAARPLPPAQRIKLEQNQRKEQQMVRTMEASMDQSIRLVDELLAKRDAFSGVTGMGAVGSRIPGTPWADIAAKLDTLKARSAFGSLQEMRANSPTGGALGAVSERELYLLQNAETQLQNSQSPQALEKGLRDYKNTLMAAKNRLRSGVDEFYDESGINAAPASQATAGAAVQRARNPQTGEVLELREGQWVPAR